MENKKKEKIRSFNLNIFTFLLSLIILIYFFYGYSIDENSAGAGGYKGDFDLIWSNLLLLKQDIFSNLDSPEYTDSRPPLSYILHIILNPFTYNEAVFRFSNLIISSTIPFLLFFSIKEKYAKLDNSLVILLSLTITLSPYFRTTAYWALGENYGIIFLLLSYLTFSNLKKNLKNYEIYKKFLNIFLLCFFSSIVVYFDQKLVFLPFLVLILILNLKMKINYKVYTIVLFFIFSLPYFYLIYVWGSLIPPSATEARGVGSKLFIFHPGYCLTILVAVIFPFFFSNKLDLLKFKNLILNKKLILIIALFTIYLLLVLFLGDFENLRVEGKGAFHKLSLLIIKNTKLRFIFTLIVFFICTIFAYIVLNDKIDLIIVGYFIILSLFTFPFYQEYLDPLMYVLILSFFKSKFDLKNIKSTYFIVIYFFVFSLSSKYYYQITLF